MHRVICYGEEKMNFDLVLLLPLAAMFLAVFYPLVKRDPYIPESFKSGRYRQIKLRQLIVTVLPIAALVAVLLPIPNVPNLIIGLALAGIVLIPAFFVHLYFNRRYAHHPQSLTNEGLMQSQPSSHILQDKQYISRPESGRSTIAHKQRKAINSK